MNIIPAKNTISRWGKNVLVAALLFTFIAPSVAFAGPDPTPAERWCWGGRDFRDGAAAVTKRACFTTQAICQVDATAARAGLCQNIWVYGAAATAADKQGNALALLADTSTAKPGKGFLAWLGFQTFDKTIGIILKGVAYVVFSVAALFLQSMAVILDRAVQITIDSNMLGNMSFVSIGWTMVRDLSNMFFIFALLFIAIQTILGLAGGGAKRLLVNLIISALLINFSLFFTKVVIDSGNVLAVSFWDKMRVSQNGTITPSGAGKVLGGLDLQTLWDKKGGKNAPDFSNMSFTDGALVYAGGAIFMFIAGYVILAAALMMITRTIVLAFLMVLSPFAFLSFSFPGLQRYFGQWWDALIKQTFVAPIFIFLLYLNSVLMDSIDLMSMTGTGATMAGATKGEPASYSIILNFIMMIGFLLATIGFANHFAGQVGNGARSLAKKFTGGVAGATAGGMMYVGARGMQQTVGRAGQRTAENKKLQNLAANGNWAQRKYANTMIKTGTVLRDQNYDVRNTKMGTAAMHSSGLTGIGTKGSKATYSQTGAMKGTRWAGGTIGAESVDQWTKEAEARFPKNPAAQEAYMRDKMGRFYGGASTRTKEQWAQEAEKQHPGNPKAQAEYVAKKMDSLKLAEQGVTAEGLNKGRIGQFGIGGGVALSGDASKKLTAAAAKIEKAQRVESAKDVLKKKPEEHEKLEAQVLELKTKLAANPNDPALTKELTDTEAKMAESAKVIADALLRLDGKDFAQLDEKIIARKIVQEKMTGDHVRGVAAYADSTGYSNTELLPAMATTIYESKNTAAKNQLNILSKTTQGTPFRIDFKSDVEEANTTYKSMVNNGTVNDVDPATGRTKGQLLQEKAAKAMGYMNPENIKDWEEGMLQDEFVAQRLNSEHLKKIVSKQKLDSTSYSDDFFTEVAKQIHAGGNQGAKDLINNSKADSPFFAHKQQVAPAAAAAQPASVIATAPNTYRPKQTANASGVVPAAAAAAVAGAVIVAGANAQPQTPPTPQIATPPTTPPTGGAPVVSPTTPRTPTGGGAATTPRPAPQAATPAASPIFVPQTYGAPRTTPPATPALSTPPTPTAAPLTSAPNIQNSADSNPNNGTASRPVDPLQQPANPITQANPAVPTSTTLPLPPSGNATS